MVLSSVCTLHSFYFLFCILRGLLLGDIAGAQKRNECRIPLALLPLT